VCVFVFPVRCCGCGLVCRYILLDKWSPPPLAHRRDLVRLPDGEFIAVDFILAPCHTHTSGSGTGTNSAGGAGTNGSASAPTLVVLHGITGGTESVQSVARAAVARGWHCVVVNRRGHGGVTLQVRHEDHPMLWVHQQPHDVCVWYFCFGGVRV